MMIIIFIKSKETKRTWRYEAEENEEVAGSLYLQKEKIKELGDPEKLRVSIEVEQE